MAENQTTRIQAKVLQADEDALVALKAMADYRPANPACQLAALSAQHEAMRTAQDAELRAQHALDAARDAAVAAQWAYHKIILAAKDQVIAQYGPDSDQVASLGLKKKSERRTPVRAGKSAT